MTPVSAVPGGVRLRVRVQPRASRTEVAGLHGGEVRIRLRAPPVDGEANEALVRFLADALGLPRSAVTIASGISSRSKTVIAIGPTIESARTGLGV